MDSLHLRREKLLYSFGKKCLILDQTKELFPKSHWSHYMKTRNQEEYLVTHNNAERFRNSTIPYIQRMLNEKSPYS